uniref:Cleavage stimulation factor subunit 2 n=1 Tax=Anthurium amnicola TaxID=1678845 RepID=A0A1D1YIQ2_9ARAE
MMPAKPQQQTGDGGGENPTVQMAGMSKNQLYDIMCQMKILIEQNPQQARQILIDNPTLTRALFQAQIMLGMVQPPKVMPNIQQASSQQSQQSLGQPNIQASQSLTSLAGSQGEYVTQPQVPVRQQQQQQQPSISMSTVSVPPLAFQSQAMPPHPMPPLQQAKGNFSAQMPHPISSQIHNLPPPHPVPQHSIHPTHIPMVSSQSQPPLQTSGIMLPPLQPPLPQQPRPPSVQPFPQPLHPQMPPGLGFQLPSAHQQLPSQPMFHPGVNPPTSFSQGQPPLPNQPPPQQLYQGASHIASDFSSPVGSSVQVDRASSWAPGLPDRMTTGAPLPGPPPLMTGQMGPAAGGQLLRAPQLTPEMEQALLQQVMSLTPEQINQLPPEHRNQVFQIQQMYRR